MITINETNFPDANFRNWLLKQDYGKDGVLTEEAIKGVTEINVRDQDISSLKGIELFTALTELDCSHNNLTCLNVSGCAALAKLHCFCNKLTSLDVSGCTALTELDCAINELTTLDVSGCTALTELDCFENKLISLNVSGCTALARLDCCENELTSLNVSGCTALTGLCCHRNQLKGAAMDRLIESLPQTGKESGLYVYAGKEDEENVCTKAQVTAARAKGWKVLAIYDIVREEGEEYDGCDE